jgi:predicted RNA binding protein YcfA (HicA-like mRNA interferase family)
MGKYPALNARQLDKRLKELGCKFLRQKGSHRHYSNPFYPDKLITFPDHGRDIPRGIIDDIVDDLGITREQFFNAQFP